MTRRSRGLTTTPSSSWIQQQQQQSSSSPAILGGSTSSTSKILQEQWQCDYCKVQYFPTLQEACHHETVCDANPQRQSQQQQQQQRQQQSEPSIPDQSSSSSNPKNPAVHPFFQAGGAKTKVAIATTKRPTSRSNTATTCTSLPKENTWMSARRARSAAAAAAPPPPPQSSQSKDTKNATRNCNSKTTATAAAATTIKSHPKSAAVSKQERQQQQQQQPSTKSSNTRPNNKHTAAAGPKSVPRTVTTAGSETVDLVLLLDDDDDDDTTATALAPVGSQQKLPHQRRRKSQTSKTTAAAAAAAAATTTITVDAAILAEQRALEFFAQRRLQQQRDRERRQQRALPSNKTTTMTTKDDHVVAASKKSAAAWAIPRFPIPSHVGVPAAAVHPPESVTTTTPTTTGPVASVAEAAVGETKPVPQTPSMTRSNHPCQDDDDDAYPYLFAAADVVSRINDSDDALRQALWHQTLVVASKNTRPMKLDDNDNNNNCHNRDDVDEPLWVDKYYNLRNAAVGVSSSSPAAAEQQLTDFIERFMVERQKVEARMAAKLQPTKKRKKVNHYYCDDDDLWEDDDDVNNNNATTESSLCLLTGPVGSGKTQLVHRVAQQLGCRKVLELHPGLPRGAAALKRCIQEATQSHSTLDMLQNQKIKKHKLSATEASWFATKPSQELVDSDTDEPDDDDDDGEAEEEKQKGASVTVILLDEVDNLYEEHGDNGFWSALSELSKRSKCPIVLTSNSWPKPMESSAFLGHTWIPVDTPTPAQCAETLYQIVLAEKQLSWRDPAVAKTNLELVATLGNCDLRRLIHELQLFAASAAAAVTSSCCSSDVTRKVQGVVRDEPATEPHCLSAREAPTVDSVRPVSVPSDEYSLLTITGSNFGSIAIANSGETEKGSPCRVLIGNQECPLARIMDDTTILAVCPPCRKPTNVTLSGLYRGSHERSRAACHAAITVAALEPVGMLSSSNESLLVLDAPDGRRILSTKPIVSVEYQFPGHITHYFAPISKAVKKKAETDDDDDGKSSENEWEWSDVAPYSKRLNEPVSPGMTTTRSSRDDQTLPSKLLQEGIAAWLSVHKTAKHPQTQTQSLAKCEAKALDQINHLFFERRLASDAAILEDVGASGLPFLAGACRGFGYNLTDDYPRLTNESNKRPMEETLILSGWKDTTCFYGQSDVYMTLSMTARERKLLKQHERAARGFGFPVAPILDEEKENENFCMGAAEEDMLLPSGYPDCIADLPSLLKSMLCSAIPPATARDVVLSTRSRDIRAEKAKDILCDYVFVRRDDTHMFFRSMSRECDPLLGQGNAEAQLFLDYLPILRSISVQERILEAIHNAAHREGPANRSSRHQRTTRQSSKRGYAHYLESLALPQTWRAADQTAKQVGDFLAETSLLYCDRKSAK